LRAEIVENDCSLGSGKFHAFWSVWISILCKFVHHESLESKAEDIIPGFHTVSIAKQHGLSVEVMLRMYAAWLDGATDADIHAIKHAMETGPVARNAIADQRTAISAANAAENHTKLMVIRPPKSSEFGGVWQ
jgi:hypothetical protein